MILGFASRDITDGIVEAIVRSVKGTFHHKTAQVGRFDKTHWKTFDRVEWLKKKTPITFFGCLRGTEHLLWDCKEHNIPYYYIDHAYVHKAIKHRINPVVKTKFYRITKNAENYNKLIDWKKDVDLERRVQKILKQKDLGIDINFYKKHNGQDIIILPPTDFICNLYHYGSTNEWIEKTINEIKKHTDRNIIIKRKEDNNIL